LAGRNLPFFMATFVAFATWFGAETVLGASSQMAKEGLWGVIEDPFGAALCLILVGLFFAKPLYRLNLLTFGDFYRRFYGRKAEIVASLFNHSVLLWLDRCTDACHRFDPEHNHRC
jgi:Na+/proline symporter